MFTSIIAILLVIIFIGGASDLSDIGDNMSFEIPIIYNGLSPRSSGSYNRSTNISLVLHDAGHHFKDASFQIKIKKRDLIYSLTMSIGTPGGRVMLNLDSGSDLTWVQCKPCEYCFPKYGQIFDPAVSSTYKIMKCNFQNCGAYSESVIVGCAADKTKCLFGQEYADGSIVEGSLSSDYFQFFETTDGRSQKISNSPLKFGCATATNGELFSPIEDGILGIGRGKLSFISQLKISRFSHCLPGRRTGETSYLSLGGAAKLEGAVVRLIQNKVRPTLYYVKLVGIAILFNGRIFNLDISPGTFAIDKYGHGGLILDTGTPFTELHRSVYAELCMMLSELFLYSHISTIRSHNNYGNEYCFNATLEEVKHISLVFTIDSVDVEISGRQLFYEEEDISGTPFVCLAIFASSDPSDQITSLFGGLAQSDYNIGYDLKKQIVTFNKTTC